MKNALLLLLIAVLLFLAIFFYWKQSQAESQLVMANEKINSLEQQVLRFTQPAPIDSLRPTQSVQPPLQSPDSVEKVPLPESTTFEEEVGSLSDSDIQRLKRKGLKNPEADLMNDLMRKQKTLLTTPGTMGGTMAIQDVRILNDRHALAYFEDGHNGGYLLLRYAVNNGAITWTRLDSYTM
ncbi:hypothetical protein ACD591_01615 [Rufibacter glacialis]|uniref:Uncharacterized protein n=1 Tax=Rufibacter glacialis TaxID=1259555 RepID=A0A5M8QKA9_9BACT|nr:hypothetical protein [Rufibacter glacialis]KAA6435591.1 hypothetical protein FOE74_06515 [Rufibacter glacialis]GGK64821.1 hypothetical protein GCM10011405_11010 [Rufibacter glacialis]